VPAAPAPPAPVVPAEPVQIVGVEHIAWDQPAITETEFRRLSFAIYINDKRSELQGVHCERADRAFACKTKLPKLSNGEHKLAVVSYFKDGPRIVESHRSPVLTVIKSSEARN
jgi:hypothetical protein